MAITLQDLESALGKDERTEKIAEAQPSRIWDASGVEVSTTDEIVTSLAIYFSLLPRDLQKRNSIGPKSNFRGTLLLDDVELKAGRRLPEWQPPLEKLGFKFDRDRYEAVRDAGRYHLTVAWQEDDQTLRSLTYRIGQ